ncbi:catechol o-methyltransferase [Fusarium albosuccineum]|uniref:catechol O-methyltransferase n=1 Tax=Fusarium albosuccineum TaxID=1237068 RepID=A0A8H4PED5_9HYPO|nr:catechol o-methyltransferase [Fusarium albosuccineum]
MECTTENHASGGIVWHGDGRESAVVNHVLNHPERSRIKNSPTEILATIDQWSKDNQILMTIGSDSDRGGLIMELISESKPKTMVEIGGYIGYSTIKFGSALRDAGGSQYISVEYNAEYAALAQSLIVFAGLQDFVQIIVGPSAAFLAKLAKQQLKIDLLFIDHEADLYLNDLKLVEQYDLLSSKASIVADNICDDKARDYVAYVQGGYKSRIAYYSLPTGQTDGIAFSTRS